MSLRKHDIKSSNDGSWTELETVSNNFVYFVADVVHSVLHKVEFGRLVKFVENDLLGDEISHF
jgi:hypothetical protein